MAILYDADGNEVEIDDSLFQQDPPEPQAPRTNADFAALRRETTARKQAEKDAETAKRNLAFYQAGVDPADTRLSYFVKGYDGPIDPDKIQEAALAAGFLQPAPPSAADVATQQALDAQARISGLSTSAGTPDMSLAQRQALDDAYKAGGMEGLAAALSAAGVPRAVN
jgi:hypothetical protein